MAPAKPSPPLEPCDCAGRCQYEGLPRPGIACRARTQDTRTPESYGLGLLTEECGELLEMIGKAGRFGIDSPSDNGRTARERITEEAGDVFSAIAYLELRGVLDPKAVVARAELKLVKLLDPTQKDNLGRRLAP